MPARYSLQYLPLFWDDLAQAAFRIRDVLGNPDAAARLLDQVEEGVLRRLENPTAAAVYKSTRDRPAPYRWFPVGNYMVFYVVLDDVMEVPFPVRLPRPHEDAGLVRSHHGARSRRRRCRQRPPQPLRPGSRRGRRLVRSRRRKGLC